jgi:hypothetical protein
LSQRVEQGEDSLCGNATEKERRIKKL